MFDRLISLYSKFKNNLLDVKYERYISEELLYSDLYI